MKNWGSDRIDLTEKSLEDLLVEVRSSEENSGKKLTIQPKHIYLFPEDFKVLTTLLEKLGNE